MPGPCASLESYSALHAGRPVNSHASPAYLSGYVQYVGSKSSLSTADASVFPVSPLNSMCLLISLTRNVQVMPPAPICHICPVTMSEIFTPRIIGHSDESGAASSLTFSDLMCKVPKFWKRLLACNCISG